MEMAKEDSGITLDQKRKDTAGKRIIPEVQAKSFRIKFNCAYDFY